MVVNTKKTVIAALDVVMDKLAGTPAELTVEDAVLKYLEGYLPLQAALAAAHPFPRLYAAVRAYADPGAATSLKIIALKLREHTFQSPPRFLN